jgi:hypothetical protein
VSFLYLSLELSVLQSPRLFMVTRLYSDALRVDEPRSPSRRRTMPKQINAPCVSVCACVCVLCVTQPTPGQSVSGSPVKLSLSEVPRAPNDEPRLQRGERRQSTSELVARLKAGAGSTAEEEASSSAAAAADARAELCGNPLAETSAAREAGDLVASPRQWGCTRWDVEMRSPQSSTALQTLWIGTARGMGIVLAGLD